MSASMQSPCVYVSQRWVFAILAGLGLCVQNLFSVIMSITLIEMIEKKPAHEKQYSNETCQSLYNISSTNQTFSMISDEENIERYSWDEYTQGIILSSFSWSSVITQFSCGSLAERFGGKYLLGIAVLTQSVITFLTPFAIKYGGSTALIVTRVLIGLGSDGMNPVTSSMLPHWTTPAERTKLGNVINSGQVFGLFVGTIMPALIIKYSGIGWQAVFYFFGILGILWTPFWLIFVYESPEVHPFITNKELKYLQEHSDIKKMESKRPFAPWKHIVQSKKFWAFILCFTGGSTVYYVTLTGLPRYMSAILNFSLENSGYFSSFPYLFMWLCTMISSWANHKILERKWMSVTNIRKLFTTISITGPVIFLIFASYAECDMTLVIIMFFIGVTLSGGWYTSLAMSPLDLSPNYAGSILSAAFGAGSLMGMLVPYFIGVLVSNSTITEWKFVFWIIFSFSCSTNVVYLVWYKAEIQPWNSPDFIRNKN